MTLMLILNFFGWILMADREFVDEMLVGESKLSITIFRISFLLIPTLTIIGILVFELIKKIIDARYLNNILFGLAKLIRGK